MHSLKYVSYTALLICTAFSAPSLATTKEEQENKLAQDPTKVVTQLGLNYSDGRTKASGSISLDPARKINGSKEIGGKEWRLGGSWLFDFGIVNFNFGNNEFDSGAEQTSYSVGTFVPMKAFGIEPAGWQIFAMAGLTYVDGKLAVDTGNATEQIQMEVSSISDDIVYVPTSNTSVYVGGFALKPLSAKWTVNTFAIASYGTEDSLGDNYHGFGIGGGAGYQFTKQQSLSFFAVYQDNSFGTEQRAGVSYKYQFQ